MDPLALQLNVVGVFNNCLEVFRLVQRGRRFGQEYEERLVKFDMAKHRLLNWGDRVAITKDTRPNFECGNEAVFKALGQLEQLFVKVQKCLEKYEKVQTPDEHFGSYEEWNKSQKGQTQQRKKQTKIIHRAKFVLDDAETLDKFFFEIKGYLDFLDSDERHRRDISVEHAKHNGQSQYYSYGDQINSPLEGPLADDAHWRRMSAPGGAVSQFAPRSGSISTSSASSVGQSSFWDSVDRRVSVASKTSSFSEPPRNLTLPELTPFEDTCMVWRESGFEKEGEQTEHLSTSPKFSNVEFSAQSRTRAEVAETSISAIDACTSPPSLGRVWRHNSFPIFNQQKAPKIAPSSASLSPSSVECFSSCSLMPKLNGRKCLASALDGSHLAILTGFGTNFEVYFFNTNQNPESSQQLETLGHHPLERGAWTGVAIAGSYLAAWGDKVVGSHTVDRNVLAPDNLSSIIGSSCCPHQLH